MERRYQSPYRHWFSGLIFEIAIFWAFIAVISLVAAVASWMTG